MKGGFCSPESPLVLSSTYRPLTVDISPTLEKKSLTPAKEASPKPLFPFSHLTYDFPSVGKMAKNFRKPFIQGAKQNFTACSFISVGEGTGGADMPSRSGQPCPEEQRTSSQEHLRHIPMLLVNEDDAKPLLLWVIFACVNAFNGMLTKGVHILLYIKDWCIASYQFSAVAVEGEKFSLCK